MDVYPEKKSFPAKGVGRLDVPGFTKPTVAFKNPEIGLYAEPYFSEMLCIERKRTERSKKPFLLMLLHVGDAIAGPGGPELLNRIVGVLRVSTRDTDLKGWYRHGSILGVIFCEICDNDVAMAGEQIHSKILCGLKEVLNGDVPQGIGVSLHYFPEECATSNGFEQADLTLYPDLVKKNPSLKLKTTVKRGVDILGSLGLMLVFSPILAGIALGVKLTSPGPILFRQQRVGQFGRQFTFLKFRSMRVNCSEKVHQEYVEKYIKEKACYAPNGANGSGEKSVYKVVDDPRITPIGRFIRKTSLDELPQFINVLRGDMSLVGPRPPIPYELDCYDVWHRRRILEMKPGITGLWQVMGRNSTTFDEMVRLDLQYTREWSLWMDIKILFLTPYEAFIGRGGH